MTVFQRGFLRHVDRSRAPLNLRVFGWRRAGRKKSPAARRFDGGGDGGFRKKNKVTGRKHGHRKKIRFSPLALIPCEERKRRIPNFIIFTKKLTTTLHIGHIYIYIYTCSWDPQYSKKIKGKDCTIFNSYF